MRNSSCSTASERPSAARISARLFALIATLLALPGCGALLLVGGAATSAIAFASGELRATEEAPLTAVDEACRIAIETLGYKDVESTRDAKKIRWRAMTAGGEPVDIHLTAREPEETSVRIRIGVFGHEGRSRLVLEQIRQSL